MSLVGGGGGGGGEGCTFFSKGKISRRRLAFICEKFCVLLALRLSQSLGHVGTLDIESNKSNKQEFLFAIKRKFMEVFVEGFSLMCDETLDPPHEKTNNLRMRKQRRRSASASR